MKRVTDLEEFAYKNIYLPYWGLLGNGENPPEKECVPYSLYYSTKWLGNKNKKDWANSVLDRIYRIGFDFPSYIQHELVDYIRSYPNRITGSGKTINDHIPDAGKMVKECTCQTPGHTIVVKIVDGTVWNMEDPTKGWLVYPLMRQDEIEKVEVSDE